MKCQCRRQIRFAKIIQKPDFGINIDIAGEVGVEAKVRAALDKVQDQATVRLRYFQKGGLTERLSSTMSSSLSTCDSQHREDCMQAFMDFLTYARTDFPTQFDTNGMPDPGKYSQSNFVLRTYDTLADPSLDFTPANVADRQIILVQRQAIATRVFDEQGDKRLGQSFLAADFGSVDSFKAQVNAMVEAIDARSAAYQEAVSNCYGANPSAAVCLDKTTTALSRVPKQWPYDPGILNVQSKSILDYCQKIQQWHALYYQQPDASSIAETIISQDSRNTVLAVLNAASMRTQAAGGRQLVIDAPSLDTAFSMTPDDKTFDCQKYQDAAESLTSFDLSGMELGDMEPLSALPSLRQLDWSYNVTDNAEAVAMMPFLEDLAIRSVHLRSLVGLGTATMRSLDIRENDFDEAELLHLGSASGLRSLNLAKNSPITDLLPMPALPSLETLDVSETGMTQAAFDDFLLRVKAGAFPLLKVVAVSGDLCSTQTTLVTIVCD